MGMDLEPVNPTVDAPKHPTTNKFSPNKIIWGRYNWSGWSFLLEFLEKHQVDTAEFSGLNDGELISKETCEKVANTIEKHIDTLDNEHKELLKEHIILWRTCGGYRQY